MPQLVFIDNEGITNPHINLAIEEYALRYFDPQYTYILFYINEPSIIIGRNQNSIEEINAGYVKARGIHVVRRLSGGGAVYHDQGNLNFSFITDYGQDRLHNFGMFTGPVAKALNEMGAPAHLQGRNDILIDGRKISGNAQFSTARRMFSHGTLLFDSDLQEVSNALNPKAGKVQSKGHASVRSRVANIAEYIERDMDVERFRRRILDHLFPGGPVARRTLSPADWEGVRRLLAERYDNWDWNVGASPPFDIQRAHRFPFGEVDVRLRISKGRIASARIYGDFLGKGALAPIEASLVGTPYDPEALRSTLASVDLSPISATLTAGDMAGLLFPL